MPTTNSISKIYGDAIKANITGSRFTEDSGDISVAKLHLELLSAKTRRPSSSTMPKDASKSEVRSFLQEVLIGAAASTSGKSKSSKLNLPKTEMNFDNIESSILAVKGAKRTAPTEPGIFPGVKSHVLTSKQAEKALAHDIEYTEAETYLINSVRKGSNFNSEAIELIVNVASHMRKFAVVEMKKVALEKGIAPLAAKLHKLHVAMNQL